jgi:Rieske Fe-S protein
MKSTVLKRRNNLVLQGLRQTIEGFLILRKEVYKMSLIEVAKVEEIPVGKMKGFTVAGKEILVVNYQGNFYAIGKVCTHAGGDLSKGKLGVT